jgi:hypothetical protein|tara:strand:- start:2224 stop:3258 length:1035 start_codon:yes stop_codon:yes gene_type:complete
MGFVTAAIIGGTLGAAGGYFGGKQAADAQKAAAEMQAEGFRFHKPYLERSYDAAEGYLSDSIDKGAYQGQTYAGQNPYSAAGNHYIGGMGAMGAQGAFDITQAGQGFANNYQDLYQSSQGDRLQNAQDYAIANSGGLVNAAMRDDRRNLQENTLTGIDQAASGSGNMNSSRAGVAEAIANRGYDDRRADTTSMINRDLMNQSLSQQNQQFKDQMLANQGLQQSYSQGINSMGAMGDFMTGAGQNLRGYQQGYLNDQRGRFEDDRDFALNQQIRYQQGILGNAVNNSPQNPVQQTASPIAGMFGGAMQGASVGMGFGDWYSGQGNPSGGNGSQTAAAYQQVYGGG